MTFAEKYCKHYYGFEITIKLNATSDFKMNPLCSDKLMSYKTNTDNIYKEGTAITAKSAPDVQLIIMRYYQRTYYCAVVGDAARKHLAYFERELIPPSKSFLKTASFAVKTDIVKKIS